MPNSSFPADDNSSASNSNAETAVVSPAERCSSDDKSAIPSPVESKLEAASTNAFPQPTEVTLVPRGSLSIELEKEDDFGGFAPIESTASNRPSICPGMQQRQSSCMTEDDLLKVLTKRKTSQSHRQGSLMTEDEASAAKRCHGCLARHILRNLPRVLYSSRPIHSSDQLARCSFRLKHSNFPAKCPYLLDVLGLLAAIEDIGISKTWIRER